MLSSKREDLQCFSEVLEIGNEQVNPRVDFSKSECVKFHAPHQFCFCCKMVELVNLLLCGSDSFVQVKKVFD